MAAYAALTSFMHVVKQVQEHGRDLVFLDQEQFESLDHKVRFLLNFLENHSSTDNKEAGTLENHIADAAYAAEDAIESQVVNQILAGAHLKSNCAVLCNLHEVIEGLDIIQRRVVEKSNTTENQRSIEVQKPESSISLRPTLISGKITVTGLYEESIRVMDWLTAGSRARQAITIVGMGGIGKTTLARYVYERPLISEHFDIRIWIVVSQQYSKHKLLLGMVLCLKGKESSEMSGMDENRLGELLYQSLSGRSYLVVMDDVWNIEAWDMVRFFLPENGNGSRVVVTTRQSNMAAHLGPSCLKMKFLDKDKSWDLFCEKAFGGETCPMELEDVGKAIVEKCKGLPLSIVVTAGLLANSSRTRKCWRKAAQNINASTLNSEDDEHSMKILSLSYNYLPIHLKPCFLYMSLFPEDHEIRVSQLVKLWVAEGFLKPNERKSLGEVAEGYLSDLVDRNLVLVRRLRHDGCIKTCEIHDLLRDLCLRIVHQGRFLCLLKLSPSKQEISQDVDEERRIVVHEPKVNAVSSTPHSSTRSRSKVLQVLKTAPNCRSFMFDLDKPHRHLSSPRLMRVLSTKAGTFSTEAVFQLVNLRHLAFMPNWFAGFVDCSSFAPSIPYSKLPPTLSSLWNVHTIICRGMGKRYALPPDFWRMSQLRHVDFDEICLPNEGQEDDTVLEKLETLSNVAKFSCDEEMAEKIPNIKKLKITYYNISMYYSALLAEVYKILAGSCHSLEALDSLSKLESLNLCFHGSPQESDLLHRVKFPESLKKLTLLGTRLEWEHLTSIGSLPNLNILVLKVDSVLGSQWDPVEGDFPCLKVLKMYNLELESLNADETHFPALESFVLEYMSTLDEIPLSLGDISTLKCIDLHVCSDSSVISTKRMVDEQESSGNEDVEARVTFRNRKDLERIMEEMELESLASDNFRVRLIF